MKMFYQDFLSTHTKYEIQEAVNDYLKLYPTFDKEQINIEQYLSNLYEEYINNL